MATKCGQFFVVKTPAGVVVALTVNWTLQVSIGSLPAMLQTAYLFCFIYLIWVDAQLKIIARCSCCSTLIF